MESKVKFSYKLTQENWAEGYDLYYKVFKKKADIVKIVMFGVLTLLFLEQVIKDPEYSAGWLCLLLCLFMVVSGFVKPKMERKNMLSAFDGILGDVYSCELFDDKIEISTESEDNSEHLEKNEDGETVELPEIPKSVIPFDDRLLKCFETKELIGLFARNGNFFLPKSQIDPESLEVLKEDLKAKLDKKYVEKM